MSVASLHGCSTSRIGPEARKETTTTNTKQSLNQLNQLNQMNQINQLNQLNLGGIVQGGLV